MKKFFAAALVMALVSLIGVVAFAAYPTAESNWNFQATADVDAGTVTFTWEVDASAESAIGGIAWTELAIYDEEPNFQGVDMVTEGIGPYTKKLGRTDNARYDAGTRTIYAGQLGDDSYPFEEGHTYYASLCLCDGQGWVWAPDQTISFTYGTNGGEQGGEQGGDEPVQGTADVSTIAFAAMTVLGCGALVIRKRK